MTPTNPTPRTLVYRAREAAQHGREIIGEWDHNPNLFDELADRIAALEDALRWFLEDPRFVVSVGGNPNVVDRMLADARRALTPEGE